MHFGNGGQHLDIVQLPQRGNTYKRNPCPIKSEMLRGNMQLTDPLHYILTVTV